jgi:hypothetical protein
MKDYLRLWAEGCLERIPGSLRGPISVVGESNQLLGPRYESASIKVTVEPSEIFEVVDLVPPNEALDRLGFPDWAVFGLLDVLMVADSAPIRAVRIMIEEAEYHDIHSSPMAFRQAGRMLAERLSRYESWGSKA